MSLGDFMAQRCLTLKMIIDLFVLVLFLYLTEVEISQTAQPNQDLVNWTSKKNLK